MKKIIARKKEKLAQKSVNSHNRLLPVLPIFKLSSEVIANIFGFLVVGGNSNYSQNSDFFSVAITYLPDILIKRFTEYINTNPKNEKNFLASIKQEAENIHGLLHFPGEYFYTSWEDKFADFITNCHKSLNDKLNEARKDYLLMGEFFRQQALAYFPQTLSKEDEREISEKYMKRLTDLLGIFPNEANYSLRFHSLFKKHVYRGILKIIDPKGNNFLDNKTILLTKNNLEFFRMLHGEDYVSKLKEDDFDKEEDREKDYSRLAKALPNEILENSNFLELFLSDPDSHYAYDKLIDKFKDNLKRNPRLLIAVCKELDNFDDEIRKNYLLLKFMELFEFEIVNNYDLFINVEKTINKFQNENHRKPALNLLYKFADKKNQQLHRRAFLKTIKNPYVRLFLMDLED